MPQAEPVDCVITGGTVVTGSDCYVASVAVDDGVIAAVGDAETMPPARQTLDASGQYLLPGAIDVHVHFRDPGFTYKETWSSGTAAAAMGGVTTVFEMPNTAPPTSTPEALAQKLAHADSHAHVDFGVYGLLGEESLPHLEELAAGGVIGFKCFMGNTFGNLPAPSTGAMLEAFERLAPTGYRIALHAETASIMARRYQQLREAGRHDPRAHVAARPAVVAVEAVSRAAVLAEWTGARVHVLHVSSAAELTPLREAKARGVDITAETCPHYLFLSDSDYDRLGSVIRVNPPIRDASDAEALWQGLQDGTLDMLATDHAPHNPDEKRNDDIWEADCGFPGVETQMPLMLSAVNEGRLGLCAYARLAAEAPARRWGLWPHKGVIRPGADADIVIAGLDRDERIDQGCLHSVNARISPYHGRRVTAVPIHTLVRGRFVMRERGLVAGCEGHGRNVAPRQRMPEARVQHADKTIAAEMATGAHASGSSK